MGVRVIEGQGSGGQFFFELSGFEGMGHWGFWRMNVWDQRTVMV
jgi:hypothetical protein